jgi:hypothetical protein
MTTAEAALRQLLADVEAANEWQRGETETKPALYDCRQEELQYLEKLARDGLVAPLAGWTEAPADWCCTHESDCDRPAIYSDGGDQGACETHAVAMGAKAGTCT